MVVLKVMERIHAADQGRGARGRVPEGRDRRGQVPDYTIQPLVGLYGGCMVVLKVS